MSYITQDFSIVPLVNAYTLTNSSVAFPLVDLNNNLISIAGQNQLIFYVDLTLGSLTSVTMTLDFSPDGTTWFPECAQNLGSLTPTVVFPVSHSFTSSGRLAIQSGDYFVRANLTGVGTVTGSSITIKVMAGVK